MELNHKALDFEVRQVGKEEDRTLEFIGSTGHVDRYGDIIEPGGWDLKNYKKNPVFLFGHDYRQPPIGKATKVWVDGNALKFRIQFADAETYAFADTIYRLYQGGFMRATSVGFADKEREPIIDKKNDGRQTGWRYMKQELYELSAVPVPANPNALMMAVQKGIATPEDIEAMTGVPFEQRTLAEMEREEIRNQAISRLAELGLIDPEQDFDGYDKSALFLALCDKVEELKVKLATQVEEVEAQKLEPQDLNIDQDQIKQAVKQALEEVIQEKGGKREVSDYISLVLNPGYEPEGERPAGEVNKGVDLEKVLQLTKQLHEAVLPRR